MASKTEQAILLAKTWLDESASISQSVPKITSFVRSYIRLCQLLDLGQEAEDWMKELSGYEPSDTLPAYRKINCKRTWTWAGGALPANIILKPELKTDFYEYTFKDYSVRESLSSLENRFTTGISIVGEPIKLHGVTVRPALQLSTMHISDILESVKNELFIKVSRMAITLEFESRGSALFEEAKAMADMRMAEISPSALTKVSKAYTELGSVEDGSDAAKIALLCIDALIDLAEGIYLPEYLPSGQDAPTRDQFVNKIKFTVRKITGSKTRLAYVDAMLVYISALKDYLQSTKHRSDMASANDAKRIVLYTYLIIRDIAELTQETEQKETPPK